MSSPPKKPQPRAFSKTFGVVHHLRTLSCITLVKTADEFRVLGTLFDLFKPPMLQRTWLWHPRVGEFPLRPYVTEREKKKTSLKEELGLHAFYTATRGVNYDYDPPFKNASDTLASFFKEEPRDDPNFLFVVDPDLGWFNDPMVVRQLQDFSNYMTHDNRWISMIVLIGALDTEVPARLRSLVSVVVDDEPLDPELVAYQIRQICESLKLPSDHADHFAELMSKHVRATTEIDQVMASTVIRAKDLNRGSNQKFSPEQLDKALREVLEARYGD